MNNLSIFITLSDGVSNRFFPLGARYIIKIIEDYHKVVFLQDRIITRDDILEKISLLSPKLIWISIQPSVEDLFPFLKSISKFYSGTIILGNIGSRWITQEQLIELNLNIIIVSGQGEDATKELIILDNKNLLNIDYLSDINNIYGYINNIYFQNQSEKIVNNQQINVVWPTNINVPVMNFAPPQPILLNNNLASKFGIPDGVSISLVSSPQVGQETQMVSLSEKTSIESCIELALQ